MGEQILTNKLRLSKAQQMDALVPKKEVKVGASGMAAQRIANAGFEYKRNPGCEKMTKPDPNLALPREVKYNIITGGL